MSTHRNTRQSFVAAARKIEQAYAEIGARIPSGIRIIGEEIMTDVKANAPGHGVPEDEGTLRGSGRVTGPLAGVVTLSFGGASAPYALVQHERMDYRHTVGEPRYLVRGVERWEPGGKASIRALKQNAAAGLRAVARR